MVRVGKICPNCKKEINYNIISFDESGNVICGACKNIIFPVDEKSFESIKGKLPVKEELNKNYSSYSVKDFKLPKINLAK